MSHLAAIAPLFLQKLHRETTTTTRGYLIFHRHKSHSLSSLAHHQRHYVTQHLRSARLYTCCIFPYAFRQSECNKLLFYFQENKTKKFFLRQESVYLHLLLVKKPAAAAAKSQSVFVARVHPPACVCVCGAISSTLLRIYTQCRCAVSLLLCT